MKNLFIVTYDLNDGFGERTRFFYQFNRAEEWMDYAESCGWTILKVEKEKI